MSQIIHLRQKIKVIETTKKITHAVRLVSMSLYTKLDKKYSAFKYHIEYLEKCMKNILPQNLDKEQIIQILFPSHNKKKEESLIVIISTTRGLCGSLNSNLFRFIGKIENDCKIISVGQKAADFIKKQSKESSVICHYKELNSNNFISMADDIFEKIISDDNNFKKVMLFSNYFKSFFVQVPRKYSLVPLIFDNKKNVSNNLEQISIWEQKPQDIQKYILSSYLRSKVMNVLFEALISEQAARFLTMDSSTNNAKNFLARLTLDFNKQRQSLITREVSELSASLIDD